MQIPMNSTSENVTGWRKHFTSLTLSVQMLELIGFERSGAEFIMAVPGPADTAVGTRIMLYENYR